MPLILNELMKNIQAIWLGVLSLAIVYLLYKQLSSNAVDSNQATENKSGSAKAIVFRPDSSNSVGQTAFVNTDTLLEKFDSFKKMRAQFEKRSAQAEAELGGRMQALEREYLETQKKVQAGTMTETLIKDAEQTLMRKQQEIAALREQKTGQLMEEEKELSKRLNDQIHDYMMEYAPAHGLKYVLGYTRGGGILYATDSLDITQAVLEGLNEKYKGK